MTPVYYGVQGLAYLMLRQFDKFISCLNRALQEQPDNARALLHLAAAEAHNGNLDPSRATFASAERLMPAPTREFFAASHPFANNEDLDFLIDGLRRAGWQG